MTRYGRKLIEVAAPLRTINEATTREKSIRHGHPPTLNLWYARRPLVAARAVIFAQMVDDPSAHPDLLRTEKNQDNERHQRGGAAGGARRDVAELAARLLRERRPSAGEGDDIPPGTQAGALKQCEGL